MHEALLRPPDRLALREARERLETPGLAMKLAGLMGAPFEKLLASLPGSAHARIADATQAALQQCLRMALRTLSADPVPRSPGASMVPDAPGLAPSVARPRNLLHKLAVAGTGAMGGAFGLLALPVELPVTTTLMFRSICDIARSQGEDLNEIETQLQCLTVLGMGGGAAVEEDRQLGYFVVRGALAQAVSKASAELPAKGIGLQGTASLARLLNAVAARFSAQVTEQVAAKSIPALGAVMGAAVNTVFLDHFQGMARSHFTVRRLERLYGHQTVLTAYQALDARR